MKTYLFLAHTIGGLTGSATYVRNKMDWLRDHGWNVVAFDGTGDKNSQIVIEAFLPFEQNRIKELFYPPSMFCKLKRDCIINRIISQLPECNGIVIESNNPIMALWGELLSSVLDAKHIIYLLGEHEVISSEKQYDFYKYKCQNDELFCIAPKVVSSLFEKFNSNIEADRYYWDASNSAPVDNIVCPELDIIEPAHYNIGYFGRIKPYTDEVVRNIAVFSKHHSQQTVNVVFLGVDELTSSQSATLNLSNVNYYLIKSQSIIPQKFFQLCDVIIGNAACARIAFQAGSKVISMNTKTNRPLGLLGYTTDQISFESERYKDGRELNTILEDVLIANVSRYEHPIIPVLKDERGYSWQEKYAEKKRTEPYKNVLQIMRPNSYRGLIRYILLNIGFVGLMSKKRYIMK